MRRRVILLLVLSGLVALGSEASGSEAFLFFRSDITLHEDGFVSVTETFRIRNEGDGAFRTGVSRYLPIARVKTYGLRDPRGFRMIEVLRDGKPEPYKVYGEEEKLVDIGDMQVQLQPGEYTYTLSYRLDAHRLITSSAGVDRFRWPVTGRSRSYIPIFQASATVRLPGDAVWELRDARGLVGPAGSEREVPDPQVDRDGTILFDVQGSLGLYDDFVVLLAWPQGYLGKANPQETALRLAAENKGIPIGFGGLAVLLAYYVVVWFIAGRGPRKGTMVIHYGPPEGMSPAVMRYVYKMGYDVRCFAAALLSIVAKGHMTLNDEGNGYVARLRKGDQTLSADERKVLGELFPKGQEFPLEGAGNQVAAASSVLEEHLRMSHEKAYFVKNMGCFLVGVGISAATLVAAGIGNMENVLEMLLFSGVAFLGTINSPPAIFFALQLVKRWKSALAAGGARNRRVAVTVIWTVVAAFYGTGLVETLIMMADMASPYIIMFLAATVVINSAFYQLLKAPTRAGRALHDAIEGFREFLLMTEKDRMNLVNPPEKTPELVTRYYPCALALDVEQQWSEGFSDVLAASSLGLPADKADLSGSGINTVTLSDLILSRMDSLFTSRR